MPELELLRYLGRLESEFIQDSFAADLANFYTTASDEQMALIKEAQAAVNKGFAHCLNDKFTLALQEFQTARELFTKAGNIIEAETISLHFIAYCYHNTNRRKEAYDLFHKVNDFCENNNYRWFLLMNLDWLIGSEEAVKHQSFTEIESIYETALHKSENIKDSYTTQKFLLSLIRKSNFVSQNSHAFSYLHKLLIFSKQPNLSARQKFRNFDKAIPILALSRFQSLSKEVVLESVSLAEPMSDPLFVIGSHINAGIVHTQAEDFETAEKWLKTALKNAEDIEDISKQVTLARIYLQYGHLERKRNRLSEASAFYEKALKIAEELNSPVLLYEIKKSKLETYQKLGNDREVEKDIYSTLSLAEKYREKILDEQDRNKFFDNEQDVYDIAIEHKLRLNQPQQAYNYSETSNSRSLLDRFLKGANISVRNQDVKIVLQGSVKPVQINKIREKIPPKVQILQYSVLKDEIIIWIITKENFSFVASKISSDVLRENVENYLALVKAKQNPVTISRKLYDLLVSPALPYLDRNKEICIIPDKILFRMPFSALISTNNKYFLEEFAQFYAPSANVFVYSTESAKNLAKIKNEKILSIGNPAFDTLKFPNLKNLPEAESESREISTNYSKATILIYKEATKDAFLKNYQNFEVIHFAGHYIVQSDFPLFSKLVMAKNSEADKSSYITNADLLDKKLPRTKLIILSACQTGIEVHSDGEGLIGLSRTFLSLGVPLIVASRWQVDSDITAKLMKNFHYLRRQNRLSTDQAIRQAQLNLIQELDGKFQSPYFWAGFSVFGGYAEF